MLISLIIAVYNKLCSIQLCGYTVVVAIYYTVMYIYIYMYIYIFTLPFWSFIYIYKYRNPNYKLNKPFLNQSESILFLLLLLLH